MAKEIPSPTDFIKRFQEDSLSPRLHNIPVLPPNPNLASGFYNRLVKMINDFDAGLDDKHEVGVRLVTFGQSVVFHLKDMGYYNPSLITFIGHTDDGNPVTLVQHVTQISILLTRLPLKDPTQPKRKVGFHALMDGEPATPPQDS